MYIYKKTAMEMGVDVMSVRGLTFKRYLEIAQPLKLNVAVITDNDGDLDALEAKYKDYIKDNKKDNIGIFYDDSILDADKLGVTLNSLDTEKRKFNFNSLEPHLLKCNSFEKMNTILGENKNDMGELLKYMNNNKAKVALSIFDNAGSVEYPEYIKNAVCFILGAPDD